MSNTPGRNHGEYTRNFIAEYGEGPWNCTYCAEVVLKIGKESSDGNIHHKDGDQANNHASNLEMMHSICHQRHHLLNKPQNGTGMLGKKHSVETRAKMSVAQKGRIVTDEQRAKISATLSGVPLSEERKAALRAAHAKRSPEEKSAQAKKASEARWAKHRKQS